jgi:hypothetical protein
MHLQDISTGTAAKIYDLLQMEWPQLTERLRTLIRKEHPHLTEISLRRRVVGRLVTQDARLYPAAQRRLLAGGAEPAGSSPLEQIKMRTAILNPLGEMTGGNYRANF